MTDPTTARVASLAQWRHFFDPTAGVFRHPSTAGHSIEHLDIDLRFVEHADAVPPIAQVDLPHVCKLTLRGGEFCQDDDDRMDTLAAVLFAINPVEVQWLKASTDPNEKITFAVHLVHPAIIAAGQEWSRRGVLRKLVLQGGYPCPNLTAPTPYAVTPAHTPLPSPGLGKTFASLSRPGSPTLKAHSFSTLPALSMTKPKAADDTKVKERAERKRLADYSLKPRFEYAFGTWAVDELVWRLDGGYTPACVVTILTHFLRAVAQTFPSAAHRDDVPLPAVVAFTAFPPEVIDKARAALDEAGLGADVRAWVEDAVVAAASGGPFTRIFAAAAEPETRERQVARLRADFALAQAQARHGAHLGVPSAAASSSMSSIGASPAVSFGSLADDTEATSDGDDDDADETKTPELGASIVIDVPAPVDAKARELAAAGGLSV
ncbi:hypothetical protein Q5752_003370 [Cryptotrichosporon argae]